MVDVSLRTAEDAVIFDWARTEGRILVTRNYQDFAPLVEHANRQGIAFPGVVFYAPSLPQGDVGAHVRALEDWIAQANAAEVNPAENTYVWIP